MRLTAFSLFPALTLLWMVTSCGLLSAECADCAPAPSPINVVPSASVTIVDAPAGALWWLPLDAGDVLELGDGLSAQRLEIVVTTSRLRALRVPATLLPGTNGNVGTIAVSVAEPFENVAEVPVLTASSSSIAACFSACSTLFDPQARPEQFELPAALVRGIDDPSDVALDVWSADVAVDDTASRLADTVAIDGGFDQDFFRSFTEDGLRIPIDAGRYTFRLRQLSTGRVSATVAVSVE